MIGIQGLMETFEGLFLPLGHNAPPFWGFLLHFCFFVGSSSSSRTEK